MTMQKLRYPTIEELYALELAARRARAEAISQVFHDAVAAVKAWLGRRAGDAGKVMRHA